MAGGLLVIILALTGPAWPRRRFRAPGASGYSAKDLVWAIACFGLFCIFASKYEGGAAAARSG